MSIYFTTPTGKKVAGSIREALIVCEQEASQEAEKSTNIYSTVSGSERTIISCNKKSWIIPNEKKKK